MRPYRVRTKSVFRPKIEIRACWPIGSLYRRESSRRPAGELPVYLLSSGEVMWSPSNEPHQLGTPLQDIVDDNDLRRLCSNLERLLDRP